MSTRTAATADTLFQIGSITKAFTSSLLLLMVDAGTVDLDTPVRHYLPEFHVADTEATADITLRHLLSHSSGLESDIYVDDRWEQGNAIARYVDRCFLLPQVHRDFGARYSYSNAAYVILGQLIERSSGMPWARAIEERVFKPLGMTCSLSSPLQALQRSVATGHMFRDATGGGWHGAPHPYVPQGLAPAGSVLAMSATDLVKFGRAHLEVGRSEAGAQWLSERSVRCMQVAEVRLPASTSLHEHAWGLGWGLSEHDGVKWFGHGGGRIGYQALLAVVPECEAVLAVMSNGMLLGGGPLLRAALAQFMTQTVGTHFDTGPPSDEPRDLSVFVGRYGATGFRFDVQSTGTTLTVEFGLEGLLTEKGRVTFRPVSGGKFAVYSAGGEFWGSEAVFLDQDVQGIPKYLYFANRLNRRLQPP